MPATPVSHRIRRFALMEIEKKLTPQKQEEPVEKQKAPAEKKKPANTPVPKPEPVKAQEPEIGKLQPKEKKAKAPKPKRAKAEKFKIARDNVQYEIWNPEIHFKDQDQTQYIIRTVRDFLRWAFSAEMKKPFAVAVYCHVRSTQFNFTKNNFEKTPAKASRYGIAKPPAEVKPMYTFSLYLHDGEVSKYCRGSGGPLESAHFLLPAINRLITSHEKST